MSPAVAPVVASSPRAQRLASLWPSRRAVVMGILNCTPDSFSDGGQFKNTQEAVTHAGRLIDQGARIIDVGGESTRPGAVGVSAANEAHRVIPVVSEIRRHQPDIVLSIDTSKAEVARAGLKAGADAVNDITGGTDAAMLEVVAEYGAGIIIMHMRGTPRTMQVDTRYDNVVAEVHHFLLHQAEAAASAGIEPEFIWLDPGIGFGKDVEANLELLQAVKHLASHGYTVVVGASRKSFIGQLTGAAVHDRLPGSLAAVIPTICINKAVVRVHDVAATCQFLDVATRFRGSEA